MEKVYIKPPKILLKETGEILPVKTLEWTTCGDYLEYVTVYSPLMDCDYSLKPKHHNFKFVEE